MAREFNFDGIVGPTHNYAGLSYGNIASESHQHQVSNPKAAALQGLQKMKTNFDLGVGQAVLPAFLRPRLELLRQIGFTGSDKQLIKSAWETDPALVATCYSAASMWTANAATVSPSADCNDGKLHFTPANLLTTLHRTIDAPSTTQILRFVFSDPDYFKVHDPLPSYNALADEGAANHTHFCEEFGSPGLELFVYGRSAMGQSRIQPIRFPARQTLESCQAISRGHGLNPRYTIFAQQNPDAIDAGVFHNDVISVGSLNFFLVHEQAFVNQAQTLENIKRCYSELTDRELIIEQIPSATLSLDDAVKSYLFNSQLLLLKNGEMTLICPAECDSNPAAKCAIDQILNGDNPVSNVRFLDLRQSMNNGGGPACLRLRVVLTPEQLEAVHPGIVFSNQLYERLTNWVETHYRETLASEDLLDFDLFHESKDAIEELAQVIQIPKNMLLE